MEINVRVCLPRDAVAETYVDVERFLTMLVTEFRRLRGGDHEEMYQDATVAMIEAMATWESEKASFLKWVRMRVFRELMKHHRRRAWQHRVLPRVRVADLDRVPERGRPDLEDVQRLLSDDGRELVYEALAVGKLVGGAEATQNRLWRTMRAEGWTVARFGRAFSEVAEVLA